MPIEQEPAPRGFSSLVTQLLDDPNSLNVAITVAAIQGNAGLAWWLTVARLLVEVRRVVEAVQRPLQ
jgi:hypothetical protein